MSIRTSLSNRSLDNILDTQELLSRRHEKKKSNKKEVV